MKTKEELISEFLNELNKKVEVDLSVIDVDKVETSWDIEEQLYETGAFNYEFIYYYNAMKYLMENDNENALYVCQIWNDIVNKNNGDKRHRQVIDLLVYRI